MLLLIGQLAVDLVGKNDNVLLHADFGNLPKVLLGHDGTGRIVRERKHEKLRLIGNRHAEFLRSQAEFIFLLKLDNYRNALRQNNTRFIGNIARLRNDNLLAGAYHGADCKVNRFTSPDRNQNLALRLVGEPVTAVQKVRNLGAELGKSRIAGIVRFRFLEGIDAFLTDVIRRRKIRLADTEGDGVLHLMNNIEKFTNAGGLDAYYGRI